MLKSNLFRKLNRKNVYVWFSCVVNSVSLIRKCVTSKV